MEVKNDKVPEKYFIDHIPDGYKRVGCSGVCACTGKCNYLVKKTQEDLDEEFMQEALFLGVVWEAIGSADMNKEQKIAAQKYEKLLKKMIKQSKEESNG